MKSRSRELYHESLDKLIDIFRNKQLLPKKKYLSKVAIQILKYIYQENLTTSVEVSVENDSLVLVWVKDDRVLEILIHTSHNIDYSMLDWNKDLENDDVYCERGILINDIETTASRLVEWLLKGNSMGNYSINNNIVKRFQIKDKNTEEQNKGF